MKLSKLFSILLTSSAIAFAGNALAQQNSNGGWFIPPTPKGGPNQATGIHTPIDMSVETYLVAGSRNSEFPGLTSEGPIVTIDTRLTANIKLHLMLAFERLFYIENSRFYKDWDFQSFLKEATIIFDCPEKNKGCFVTAIGKQTIPTGLFESALPIDLAVKGLSQEKGVYGIRMEIDQLFAGALDEVVVSAFQQIRDHKITETSADDGDTHMRNGTGASVFFSKQFTERLKVGGGFTVVAFHNNPGVRSYTKVQGNLGFVYKINDKFRVFAQGIWVSNYFPYPRARFAVSAGAVYHIWNGDLSVVLTHIQNTMTQFGVGYTWEINENWSVGPQVVYNQCKKGESTDTALPCYPGVSTMVLLQHRWEKTVNAPRPPSGYTCTVGDPMPGCTPGKKFD